MGALIERVGRSDTETPARLPDEQAVVERDGVRIHWESYGEGGPTILLLPTWSVIHSRNWKAQIPYLARHFRVVTFDGRGNGFSDRPGDQSAYTRGSSSPTRSPCSTQRASRPRASPACRWAACARCCSPPVIRSASTACS